MRKQKYEQTKIWRECQPIVREQGIEDDYYNIWKKEKRIIREIFKTKAERKVKHLCEKYRPKARLPDEVNGVIIRDQEIAMDFESKPRCYGGIQINEDERKLLELPPNFSVYENVDEIKTIAQIEKGFVKLRWERNNIQKNHMNQNDEIYDREHKTFNFENMRASAMTINKKVSLPGPLKQREEAQIQRLRNEMVDTVEKYIEEEHNIGTNLTQEERKGMKSMLERKKNMELVTNITDKSGRFSVDTVENYITLNEVHTNKDIVIQRDEYEARVNEMNAHSASWCIMFNLGKERGEEKKIRRNFHNGNPPLPGHRTLRKDHKEGYDEIVGPPGRPLCSADGSFNYGMSHFLSMVLKELLEGEETICEDTEDMMAEFDEINRAGGVDRNTIIGSADVKSLYPSLDIEYTTEIICEMFKQSDIDIHGVDYDELGLYIALNRNQYEINKLGLREYCPMRKYSMGARPNVKSYGTKLSKSERFMSWHVAERQPTTEQKDIKKKMITEAIRIILIYIMKNHIYEFDNKIYKQKEGGAIGVELTGTMAQIFMVWWDKRFQEISKEELQLEIIFYKRYVDDINVIVKIPEGRENAETTNNVGEIERNVMEIVKDIGNQIHNSIEIEVDYPSKYSDKKLPILDLKVWLEEIDNKHYIKHEYYHKKISSKAVINARSAMSWKSKRTILVQQTIRIMRNCSRDLPWEDICKHLSDMMKRIQFSGYDQKFRYDILTSALKAYGIMKEKDVTGERPLYRKKAWRRNERRNEKHNRKRNWFRRGGYESIIFVPCTPKAELMKRLRDDIQKTNIKIKLIESSGTNLKDILRTSDPRKEKRCHREDCPVCNTGGKGDCQALDVNYKVACSCGDEYNGTTTRSAYNRGTEHFEHLNDFDTESDLLQHCNNKHGGMIQQFKMSVTEKFKRDPTLRQISEAVRISATPQEHSINNREECKLTKRNTYSNSRMLSLQN